MLCIATPHTARAKPQTTALRILGKRRLTTMWSIVLSAAGLPTILSQMAPNASAGEIAYEPMTMEKVAATITPMMPRMITRIFVLALLRSVSLNLELPA